VSSGMSRRDFLKAAGRLLALGGIGAIAVRVIGWTGNRAGAGTRRTGGGSDSGTGVRAGETCITAGVCRGCSVFSGCGLPSALSARQRAAWARGQS
jgi:hypothetical protein